MKIFDPVGHKGITYDQCRKVYCTDVCTLFNPKDSQHWFAYNRHTQTSCRLEDLSEALHACAREAILFHEFVQDLEDACVLVERIADIDYRYPVQESLDHNMLHTAQRKLVASGWSEKTVCEAVKVLRMPYSKSIDGVVIATVE